MRGRERRRGWECEEGKEKVSKERREGRVGGGRRKHEEGECKRGKGDEEGKGQTTEGAVEGMEYDDEGDDTVYHV